MYVHNYIQYVGLHVMLSINMSVQMIDVEYLIDAF